MVPDSPTDAVWTGAVSPVVSVVVGDVVVAVGAPVATVTGGAAPTAPPPPAVPAATEVVVVPPDLAAGAAATAPALLAFVFGPLAAVAAAVPPLFSARLCFR